MTHTPTTPPHPRHRIARLACALCLCLAAEHTASAPEPALAQEKAAKPGGATTAQRLAERRAERRAERAAKRAAAEKKAKAAPGSAAQAAPVAPAPLAIPGTLPAGSAPAARGVPSAPPAPAGPPAPARPITPAAPIAPRPAGTPSPLSPAEETTKITPFETGIDYQAKPPSALVTFNLEDADLPDLVRLISQITGKSFILPGKSRSIKATVYAPNKVTVAEAYQAFLSILELNGMSIVPAGRYLKLVESGRIEGRPIPLYGEDEAVPTGDRFVTRIHPVKNITAEDAAALLERFKSGDGSITAYAPTNVLIMTDTGTNMRRMLRLLEAIDVERTGEQIWVEPIHHADATDLAQKLGEIFDVDATGTKATARPRAERKPAKPPTAAGTTTPTPTPGSSTVGSAPRESHITKIIADERTNSLIILATETAYLRILEMLKQLDVSLEGEGRIHVHHLQHTDADEIASTLSALISGRASAPAGGKGGGGAAAQQESVFEGGVAVTAHKASNALVITSSTHDYAALRHVIDQLDSERKQVFIEAVIMELSVDRSSSLGTSFHGGVPDFPSKDSTTVTGFRAANTIGGLGGMAANGDVLSGMAVGVQGPAIPNSVQLVGLSLPAFGVAINALASSGDANILSTPHLIATDNIEAEISVGQNVPLQTGATAGGLGGLGALAALQGNQAGGAAGLGALSGLAGLGGAVPRQDVGTTVKITPHINATDEIRLEISQEISSAGAPSQSGSLGVVSIDRTRAKTDLVVRDQQTVVIGGLMRDQLTTSDTKVPVLGDIPLIGALFRSSSKQKIKKNLLLFLTPYIVRSPADLRAIYERKMRERQEFLDRYFVFSERDYEAPVDYSRTRGLVGEILLEIGDLDAQRKLIADAAARPETLHVARPAVGSAPDHLVSDGVDGEVIEPEGPNLTGSENAPPPEAAPPPPAPEAPPQGSEGQ